MAKSSAQEAGLEHPIALCHLEVPCCPFDSTACIPRSCARTPSKIILNSWRFKEPFQLPDPGWMPHLAQRLCLDLADSLASNLELPADFFQCSALAVDEPESLLEDLPFSVGECFQDIFDLFLEQNDRSHIARVFGAPVFNEIAKVGFLTLAYWRLQRYRLLGHL